MTAIEQAYASNSETPILTLEMKHSAFDGGVMYLAKSKIDFDATLEDAQTVTFQKMAIDISIPSKSTDGEQSLNMDLSNINNIPFFELRRVVAVSRNAEEKVVCVVRTFLPSDLSAPAGEIYKMTLSLSASNRNTVSLSASYTPLPYMSWPVKRYHANAYPWLRYV